MQALSRIYLDSIPNIQSSWVTQGQEIRQIALKYGANDLGSIMIEENVVSQAGRLSGWESPIMQRLIRIWDYEPHQRDNWYNLSKLKRIKSALSRLLLVFFGSGSVEDGVCPGPEDGVTSKLRRGIFEIFGMPERSIEDRAPLILVGPGHRLWLLPSTLPMSSIVVFGPRGFVL